MTQPGNDERFCFWRQQARASEFTGVVHLVALIMVVTALAVAGLAACLDTPAVYFLDGIARIYERVLAW